MREDAARAMRAEDYELLRSRAEARLRAVEPPRGERASAEDWRAQARPAPMARRSRAKDRSRPARDRAPGGVDSSSASIEEVPVASASSIEAPPSARLVETAAPSRSGIREPALARTRIERDSSMPPGEDGARSGMEEDLTFGQIEGSEFSSSGTRARGRHFARETARQPSSPHRRARAPQEKPRRTTPPRAYGTSLGAPPQPYGSIYGGKPGRRTIQITGNAAPRVRQAATVERFAARPDRTAMWAVLLGLFLVLMAVVTAHS